MSNKPPETESPQDAPLRTMMIVDDDLFIRSVIRKVLGPVARYIDVAHSAAALEEYQKYKPDIVFIDIHMPQIDGFDVLAQILTYDPQAHVLLMSADGQNAHVMRGQTLGAKGFLVKPIQRDALFRYVTACPAMYGALTLTTVTPTV